MEGKRSYKWPDGEVKVWTGLATCCCYDCREIFNSVTAFDKHRKDFKCETPESLGMEKNGRGYWVTELFKGTEWPNANKGAGNPAGLSEVSEGA
jgi:hypothetical protein